MIPKLSICIPTYNRAKYLDILLNSIYEQITPYVDYIEILISNNASTDNTQEIIDKYQYKNLKIHYIKNFSNIGADKNIAQCFTAAKGQYIWIMGDDDALLPGALNIIIDIISHGTYGLIYLNGDNYDNDYPPTAKINKPIRILPVKDRVSFARLVNIHFTFISGNIINKELYFKYAKISDIDQYYQTFFVQLAWVLPILKNADAFLYIHNSLILAKANNSFGYDFLEVFGKNLVKTLFFGLREHPKLMRVIVSGALSTFLPAHFMLYRLNTCATQNNETHIKRSLLKAFSTYYSFWIYLYPMFFLPKFALRPWYYMLIFIKKINDFFYKNFGKN